MAENSSENKYMKLLSIKDEAAAIQEIKKLASDLTDHQHLIRSCIFDLHAAVEVELRRIFFFHFQPLLFFTDDKKSNRQTKDRFEKMIQRLGFMDMWRILRPIMIDWYASFENIEKINETRNQAAHGGVSNVKYDGRSPFDVPDCLCQIYFDVWAIKQEIPKFFDHLRTPIYRCRSYFEKHGDIGISSEIIKSVDNFYDKN